MHFYEKTLNVGVWSMKMVIIAGMTVSRRPKYRRYQLNRRLVGPHSRSEPFREKKNNLLPLPGIEARFLSFSTRSLYTIQTDLSQLLQHLKREKKKASPTYFCTCELTLLPRDYAISHHSQVAEQSLWIKVTRVVVVFNGTYAKPPVNDNPEFSPKPQPQI
jgi:hypothetical protein